MRTGLRRLLLTAMLAAPGLAAAVCENGYPNIPLPQDERESEFVIVGTLMSYRRVADPEDSEGYAATLYWVHVDRVLRGRVPARARRSGLTIYNENTSARFPFDDPAGPGTGKRYLMFVRSGPNGYWVSACGHSRELDKSLSPIRAIKPLD
jgi:hypothetical protein